MKPYEIIVAVGCVFTVVAFILELFLMKKRKQLQDDLAEFYAEINQIKKERDDLIRLLAESKLRELQNKAEDKKPWEKASLNDWKGLQDIKSVPKATMGGQKPKRK